MKNVPNKMYYAIIVLIKKIYLNYGPKKEGDEIANTIVVDFMSHYIVSSKDYVYLNNVLDNNKHFQKVVNDSNNGLYVYKIIE